MAVLELVVSGNGEASPFYLFFPALRLFVQRPQRPVVAYGTPDVHRFPEAVYSDLILKRLPLTALDFVHPVKPRPST
jgi:hypothetical protein